MTVIFDSHAHLTDEKLNEDLEQIIARANANNVCKILAVADSLASCAEVIDLAKNYPNIYPTAGIHPNYSEDTTEADIDKLKQIILSNVSVKAVGEIGLDFYYGKDTKEYQYSLLETQLAFALETSLPVILHCRDAELELINILDNFKGIKGVIHCFSSTRKWCEKFVEAGFYVSFSGIVTFKNANDVREAAQSIPLDRMLVETDCPYLAPQGHRGKTNEPALIVNTIEKIAEIRKLSFDCIAENTYLNTINLFRIEDNNYA